jgi:hypothetical protein
MEQHDTYTILVQVRAEAVHLSVCQLSLLLPALVHCIQPQFLPAFG